MSIFVVHKHHASHLHWDFRLEMDGVLKRLALPKKSSRQKEIKRLAIQSEDHLLDANFKGEIPPAGHYEAERVIIWNKGAYALLERKPDKLVFDLVGYKS